MCRPAPLSPSHFLREENDAAGLAENLGSSLAAPVCGHFAPQHIRPFEIFFAVK